MYYLLDNNLIINQNDERIKCFTYSMDKTETYIYLKCDSKTPNAIWDCTEYYYATRHLILKQSENVFDLIGVGDLVCDDYGEIYIVKIFDNGNDKYRDRCFDRYNGELYVKYEACDDEYYSYIETIYSIDIIKIYKPNKNGDYIKVWEVLEDDK